MARSIHKRTRRLLQPRGLHLKACPWGCAITPSKPSATKNERSVAQREAFDVVIEGALRLVLARVQVDELPGAIEEQGGGHAVERLHLPARESIKSLTCRMN